MIEQGSAEWYAARAGKVTASRISDMLAKTKTGWGASRKNYAAQLVAERLTGMSQEEGRYQSFAMKRGKEVEPEARADYEFYRDCKIEPGGFVDHPLIPGAGASPDGFVGSIGLVEIKCPETAQHIATLLGAKIDRDYMLQMQFQMACCPDRQWADWMSYDPLMPEHMRRVIFRVFRDSALITEINREVRVFLAEIGETVESLTRLYPKEAA